jgi:hypothetical protein
MNNPSNSKEKSALPKGYQPMSSGTQRLTAPEREGYHRRWFRGDPGRIARAQQAGYEFVSPDDVELNNLDLGGDAKKSGNTDLGSRVSVISGDEPGPDGQYGRMYLMECPIALYEHSRALHQDRVDDIADSLRGGKVGAEQDGETKVDSNNRYLKGKTPDLFIPKNR